jgi:hypothetical protein
MIERVVRLEADVDNIRKENRLFRDEIRQAVEKVSQQNDAIYEIATSVKLISQDLQGLKSDVRETNDDLKGLNKRMDREINNVHQKQGQLKDSINNVDSKDAHRVMKVWEGVKDKLIWLVIGAVATYFLNQAFPFLK